MKSSNNSINNNNKANFVHQNNFMIASNSNIKPENLYT